MESSKGIKVILLGESGVGKTNLINITIGKSFKNQIESTIGSSFIENTFEYKNKKYLYLLWDTAGQEKYRSLNQFFIQGSKIVMVVFSIIDEKSFKEIKYWINYVKETLGNDKYILALVANKSDLFEEQEVNDNDIIETAKEYKIKYVITSALTDAAGFRLFVNELIQDYIELIGLDKEKNSNFQLSGGKNGKKKNKKKKKKFC